MTPNYYDYCDTIAACTYPEQLADWMRLAMKDELTPSEKRWLRVKAAKVKAKLTKETPCTQKLSAS